MLGLGNVTIDIGIGTARSTAYNVRAISETPKASRTPFYCYTSRYKLYINKRGLAPLNMLEQRASVICRLTVMVMLQW